MCRRPPRSSSSSPRRWRRRIPSSSRPNATGRRAPSLHPKARRSKTGWRSAPKPAARRFPARRRGCSSSRSAPTCVRSRWRWTSSPPTPGRAARSAVETVRALTPVARQGYIFDLTDALARRDRARALTLLHELLAQGESPLGIVAITASQTRAMLKVKSLGERGMRPFQIAQQTGLNPFVVEKSLPLARKFTFEELEATHRRLLDVDLALKRSRMTPEMALDLLVMEFGLASA